MARNDTGDNWTYFGISISRASWNNMGLRWISGQTPAGFPAFLRSDTKEGMREMIRHYRSKK